MGSSIAGQLIGVALFALANIALPFNEHPLRPWHAVGSGAFATIVNPTDIGPLDVVATAPEVDSAERYLGAVDARDSLLVKLPYVDARVALRIGGSIVVPLNVDRPLHVRITLQERQP